MNDKCADNPGVCPLTPRVEALERANEQHGSTHREIFSRLNSVELDNAVQNANYKAINTKLDELTVMVKELSGKAGKRWETLVEKTMLAVAAAVVAFLLARIGL